MASIDKGDIIGALFIDFRKATTNYLFKNLHIIGLVMHH